MEQKLWEREKRNVWIYYTVFFNREGSFQTLETGHGL